MDVDQAKHDSNISNGRNSLDLSQPNAVRMMMNKRSFERRINASSIMFDQSKFTDVELTIPNCQESISAHRIVLAASSDFLREEMDNGRKSFRIEIRNLQALISLVRFCYSGFIDLNENNVLEILKGAILLQITDLVSICFQYVKNKLNPQNCMEFLNLAAKCNANRFRCLIKDFIIGHFGAVCGTNSFLSINAADLVEILISDDLIIESEEMVFQAIVNWYKHDDKNRLVSMKPLLSLIRYSGISLEFLNETGKSFMQSVGCHELLADVLMWHLLKGSSPSFKTTPRNVIKNGSPAFVAVVQSTNTVNIHGYDMGLKPLNGSFGKIEYPTTKPLIYSIRWASNVILFCGENQLVEQIYEVSLMPKIIEPLPLPKCKYCNFDVSVIQGKLYVLGHHKPNTKKLCAMECYDPETRTWTDLRAIESLKMQFSAVSVHNELYVGYKERTTIKFYKYSTTTNLWTAMESIEFSGIVQATIQLLPMKDSLQVLITTETEIEIYENTLTGLKWREIKSIDIGHQPIQDVHFFKNGIQFFLFITPMNIVRKYDEWMNMWIAAEPLDIAAIGKNEIQNFIALSN